MWHREDARRTIRIIVIIPGFLKKKTTKTPPQPPLPRRYHTGLCVFLSVLRLAAVEAAAPALFARI